MEHRMQKISEEHILSHHSSKPLVKVACPRKKKRLSKEDSVLNPYPLCIRTNSAIAVETELFLQIFASYRIKLHQIAIRYTQLKNQQSKNSVFEVYG